LIAVIWAHGYRLLESLSPGAFQRPVPASTPAELSWSLTYFSFATLTTVGYGDVTVVHPVGQSMAMLEGLLGQLYPAIPIGRLVGNWSATSADG
jgi:hypothetical protein